MRLEAKTLGAAVRRVEHATNPSSKYPCIFLQTSAGDPSEAAWVLRAVATDNLRLAVAVAAPLTEPTDLAPVALAIGDVKALLYYLARAGEIQIALRDGGRLVTFFERDSALTLANQQIGVPSWQRIFDSVEADTRVVREFNAAFLQQASNINSAYANVTVETPANPMLPLLVRGYDFTEYIMPFRTDGHKETPPSPEGPRGGEPTS